MPLPRRFAAVVAALMLVAASLAVAGEPQITFLEGDAARKAIVDESVEPYFKLLQPLEMEAKTGHAPLAKELEAQREEMRHRYAAGVQDFTEEEKQTLTWYIKRLHPKLEEFYPRYAAVPWSFIKLSSAFEGGMPHTRSDSIVVCSTLLDFAKESRKVGDVKATIGFGPILLHEKTHVLERRDPKLFESLFTGVWGFIRAPHIEGTEKLTERQIVNPDGVDTGWVFPFDDNGKKRYIWPMVRLNDTAQHPHMPMDFDMVAVELEKTDTGFRVALDAAGSPTKSPLKSIAAYNAKLPHVHSMYHPNEIAADSFSRTVILAHFIPDELVPQNKLEQIFQKFAPTRDWIDFNFKASPAK